MPFSTGRGGVLVGTDDGGVDLDEPVDVVGRIRMSLDLLEGKGEHTVQGVTTEVGADGMPWTVAFRPSAAQSQPAASAELVNPIPDR
jgi:hypothetical protein